jgi:hypothetical protein
VLAVPLALLFGGLALSGLLNALLLRAPVWFGLLTLAYLAGLVLLPRFAYKRSVRRGHDRLIALKFAAYTVLGLTLPALPVLLTGAM